jgi:Flp pilus assembly protein TadD
MRSARILLLAAIGIAGCTEYQPFDSTDYLRQELVRRLGATHGAAITIPFELDAAVRQYLATRLRPSGGEERRANDIVDFVFQDLDLQYRLRPTRNAVGTFAAREGNCLSFVNLFVGIARENRLNAFYVEVTDAQRWSYVQGTVISQGHIVAGMNVGGKLRTYDFLPFSPKSYRDFQPIDDTAATAHFYNNLGAEALLEGDVERGTGLVRTATEIAPRFAKAINNLGVARMRAGDVAQAEAAYRQGLAVEPDNPALLTNLLRLLQQTGRRNEAEPLLAQLEGLRVSNPFFYLYRGQEALARGETQKALEYMVEALRRESELPEVHVGLAQVYLAAGELDRARYHVGRALKLDATHPEARQLLAMLGR